MPALHANLHGLQADAAETMDALLRGRGIGCVIGREAMEAFHEARQA